MSNSDYTEFNMLVVFKGIVTDVDVEMVPMLMMLVVMIEMMKRLKTKKTKKTLKMLKMLKMLKTVLFSAAASSVPSSSRGSQAHQLTLTQSQVQIQYFILLPR